MDGERELGRREARKEMGMLIRSWKRAKREKICAGHLWWLAGDLGLERVQESIGVTLAKTLFFLAAVIVALHWGQRLDFYLWKELRNGWSLEGSWYHDAIKMSFRLVINTFRVLGRINYRRKYNPNCQLKWQGSVHYLVHQPRLLWTPHLCLGDRDTRQASVSGCHT